MFFFLSRKAKIVSVEKTKTERELESEKLREVQKRQVCDAVDNFRGGNSIVCVNRKTKTNHLQFVRKTKATLTKATFEST